MRDFAFIFIGIALTLLGLGYPPASLSSTGQGRVTVQTQDQSHCAVNGYSGPLGLEYFSQYVLPPGGQLSIKLEGNKVVFNSPIKGANCFTGSPLKIGFESIPEEKYYFLTLRASNDQEAIDECINSNEPGIVSVVADRDISSTKPLIWGAPTGLDSNGRPISRSFELGSRADGQSSCFRGQKISEQGLLVTKKGEDQFRWNDIITCSDCAEGVLDKIDTVLKSKTGDQAEEISQILRVYAMDSLRLKLTEHIKELQSHDVEMGDLDSFGFDPLIDELKEFIWGSDATAENPRIEGLFSHYHQLTKKSRKSQEEKEELAKIRDFLTFIKNNFSPGKGSGATIYLKDNHAYDGAENMGSIGIAADIVLSKSGVSSRRSRESSFGQIRQDIHQENNRWSRSLTRDKEKWEKEFRILEAEQYARENPDKNSSEPHQKKYQQALARHRNLDVDYAKWRRKSQQEIYQICHNIRSLGFINMRYSPYTKNGRRRVNARCEHAQRRARRINDRWQKRLQDSLENLQPLGIKAARITEAEREGHKEKADEEDYFNDKGFGHSDDLYSPYMTGQDAYRQYGFLQSPLPVQPPSMMGSLPPTHGGGLPYPLPPPSGYSPHGPVGGGSYNFSPNMFRQDPPSYAIPPNFYSSHPMYPRSGEPMQRQPAGWFVPPPPR